MRADFGGWNGLLFEASLSARTQTKSMLSGQATLDDLGHTGLTMLRVVDSKGTEVNRIAEQSNPGKLACKQGCNACCHQPFRLGLVELVALVTEARRLFDSSTLDQLASAFGNQRGALVKGAVPDRSLCPLNSDGACTVYGVRPIVCRTFGSLSAESCHAKFIEGSDDVIVTGPPSWSLGKSIRTGISNGLKDLGLNSRLFSSAVLSIALKDPDSLKRVLEGSDEYDVFDEEAIDG